MNRGFKVAVGLLESQLKELRLKTMYYRDEQKLISHRQDYEVQALREIADERQLTVERLKQEYNRQK